MKENALIVMNDMPTTKEDVKSFVKAVIDCAKEGITDPLKIKGMTVAIKKAMEEIEKSKEFNDLALDEALKHGTKSFEYYNAKFTISEVGTKYDYSNCGSSRYEEILQAIEKLTEEKKEFEKVFQTIQKPFADPETGEIIKPATKTSTTRVNTSLL